MGLSFEAVVVSAFLAAWWTSIIAVFRYILRVQSANEEKG